MRNSSDGGTSPSLRRFPWLARRKQITWADLDPIARLKLRAVLQRLSERVGGRWRVAYLWRTGRERVLLVAPGGRHRQLWYRSTRRQWEKA